MGDFQVCNGFVIHSLILFQGLRALRLLPNNVYDRIPNCQIMYAIAVQSLQ